MVNILHPKPGTSEKDVKDALGDDDGEIRRTLEAGRRNALRDSRGRRPG